MVKNHSEQKSFFFFLFYVCVHRCSPCQHACFSKMAGFHQLPLTDDFPGEEIRSCLVKSTLPCHSFHSSLSVYACLLSSFSHHARVYICWSDLPSVYPSSCSLSWFIWLATWQLYESVSAGKSSLCLSCVQDLKIWYFAHRPLGTSNFQTRSFCFCTFYSHDIWW